MLIYTSDNLPAHQERDTKAAQRDRFLKWLAAEETNAICDETAVENDPTLILSRIGKPMNAADLETRLVRLNGNLVFRWNEFNSTKKAVYRTTLTGIEYLFPYEAGMMPERSIMSYKEEMIPDPQVFEPGFVIERKEFNSDGSNPYYRKVKRVWAEKQRGWRTVLLKLVKCGALTVAEAESIGGAANTKEWQGHLGKAAVTTPW